MTVNENVARWAQRAGIIANKKSLPQTVPLEDPRIIDCAVDTYWRKRRVRAMVGDRPGAREVGVLDVVA